ncbi:MAG: Rpn family recombination-promoting nuclease/putative transposase [Spirochaetaceae bacterium]|nr:Rpn family recombination-promoting nuclease/putative transposase [Spirochaetaceae bacterium]
MKQPIPSVFGVLPQAEGMGFCSDGIGHVLFPKEDIYHDTFYIISPMSLGYLSDIMEIHLIELLMEVCTMMNDSLFKQLFADPGNTEILADFLASVLDIPKRKYRKVAIVTEDRWLQRRLNLRGIFDVDLKTPSGDVIYVEIRLKSFPWVKKSATITIVEKSLFPEHLAHHEFLDCDGRWLGTSYGTIENHTLVLSNVHVYPGLIPREEKLKEWLCLLKAETVEEIDSQASRIQHKDVPMIQKAIEIVRSVSPKMKTVS